MGPCPGWAGIPAVRLDKNRYYVLILAGRQRAGGGNDGGEAGLYHSVVEELVGMGWDELG